MKRTNLYIIALVSMVFFTGCLTTAPVSEKKPAASDANLEEGFILEEKSLYEYDENGMLVKEEFFENKDGIVEKTEIVYEYDNNLLISKKYFDKNNKLDEYKEFSYGADGRILRETEFRSDGSMKNYKDFEYSENGSYIKKYFKKDGKFYRYIIKKYDSNGNLKEVSDYETE